MKRSCSNDPTTSESHLHHAGRPSTADIEVRLKGLEEKAAALSEKSLELNKIIGSLEKKLAAMNLGIEVWLFNPETEYYHRPPETASYGLGSGIGADYSLESEKEQFVGSKDVKYSRCAILGYCKIGNAWRLAVKEGKATDDFTEETSAFREERRIPLAEATRRIRVTALGKFERLLEVIGREVERMLADIEKGEKAIESVR